jgi:hypothetical protein
VSSRCNLPPEGWICTRPPGHPNPCAAWPIERAIDDDLITMAEVIVAGIYEADVRRSAYDKALLYLREVAASRGGSNDDK